MRIVITLLLLLSIQQAVAQNHNFGELPLEPDYRLKTERELPPRVNNAELKYFPDIINQHGWSCNQASSIGYVLTYELNALRDLDSKAWANQYPPLFAWNFLNRCVATTGVSYFDTWEVIKAAGCATNKDFPVYNDTRIWMSGYEKYYRAMKNRIIRNYSIGVGTPEGLLKLKNFLYDHANGSENGGLANIQISSDVMNTKYASDDSPDPGAPVIINFGQVVGHALTIVGYDDRIGIDVNGDGEITNHLDINGDGVVDLEDWEMGAVLVANTWSKGWGREGLSYVLYRVLAHDGHQGGIWNESVHVIRAVREFEPLLTMKVVMDHSSRNKFSLLAGLSTNPDATEPEHVMGFPHFNFQGDNGPLFSDDPEDSTRFELGLDISSLTSFLEPGKPVRFFLIVDEKDPANVGQGTIRSLSVIHHTGDTVEYLSDETFMPIMDDTVSYFSVVADELSFDPLKIQLEATRTVETGKRFEVQLQADGGTEPYIWELLRDFEEEHFERPFPSPGEDTLLKAGSQESFFHINLPFSFPYYGEDYIGLIVDRHGAIHFNAESLDYPYAIDTDLRFMVRRSLIPFGRELSYTDPADMISYHSTDEAAVIIYDATVKYLGEKYNIQFATWLYPDGTIEFHYGDFGQPPGSMYDWLTGISNGDGQNFKYASINSLGVLFPNYGARFRPIDYPADVSLTDDGLLSCTPTVADRIWNIYVRVKDKNNQVKTGAVPISTVQWEEAETLATAYPNPFAGVTTILFRVPSEQPVRLRIFDMSGRLVKDLLNETMLAGDYELYWNGTNINNRDVVPGVYFYRLEMPDGFSTRQIVKIQ